jgi:iron complex transport system permease protein
MTAEVHPAIARDESTSAAKFLLAGCLSILLAILLVASLFAGVVSIPAEAIAGALLGQNQSVFDTIIWEPRVPRTLLAALIGASLGLSGAVLQGLLRNPLASPGVIGVSASAALGAVIAFYTGLAAAFPLGLPLGGMIGAAASVTFLVLLAGRSTSTLTLILAGVAVNSLAGALTWLVLNLSPNPYTATEIIFWMMGSLADRSFQHVHVAAALMIPGWILMASCGRGLDALSLGEDAATSMGIHVASSLAWRCLARRSPLAPPSRSAASSASSVSSFRICSARWSAISPVGCCWSVRSVAPSCWWPPTSRCVCFLKALS